MSFKLGYSTNYNKFAFVLYMFLLCNPVLHDGVIGCAIQVQCRVLMDCCPRPVTPNLLSDFHICTPSSAVTSHLTEGSGLFLIPLQL